MSPEARIEFVKGDLTDQPNIDAVVNAANAQLLSGGGVCGAIHEAAGPRLAEACRPLARVAVGDTVATPGFDLPNAHVFHAVGPRYGIDRPEAELLASCHRRALEIADGPGLTSVAFPAISTGIYGYPVEDAAPVALAAVRAALPNLRSVRVVRFVLFGEATLAALRQAAAHG
jgi:O-acetyl-ADP-ribose deacetylase